MANDSDQGKQSDEAAAFRQALRREGIAAREALPASEHARKSAAVLDHLQRLLTARKPGMLAFYWPIRAEIDCRPLVSRLLALGWRVCLPVVLDRAQALEFREWTPESHMVPGAHGIPTVAAGPTVRPDVLLLPVNAFDREGYRLGYGGGYFDRTLATLLPRPYAIGVGFDLARVDSIGPHAQDCALDAVATEGGIERFPLGASQPKPGA
ncbi:MAG: 5-formyltetrahydrofolate cyclo-ligase [Georgfuchsia sp.]